MSASEYVRLMGVSAEMLDAMREEFATASWALWSSNFPESGPEHAVTTGEDLEALAAFFEANRDRLNPRVVLLGYHPPNPLTHPFENFHSTESQHRDHLLRDAVERAQRFEGAYMSNLLKRSGGPEADERAWRLLETELDSLGQPEYEIVCLHKTGFSRALEERFEEGLTTLETPPDVPKVLSLDTTLGGHQTRFYVVHSYAQGHHDELAAQLAYLNARP